MKASTTVSKYLAIVFIVLASFTEVGVSVFLGKIFDGISSKQEQIFVASILISIALIIMNFFCSIFSRMNLYLYSGRKCMELKEHIYQKELLKSREESYDIANFTTKIESIYTDYYLSKWMILENCVLFVLACVVLISIHWLIFITAVLVSCIPLIVPKMTEQYVQKKAVAYSEESTNYVKSINDWLQGRLEIKKYQVIDQFLKKHGLAVQQMEQKRYEAKYSNYFVGTLSLSIGFIVQIGIFLVGGYLTFKNLITIGQVMATLQLMNNIFRPIISVANYRTAINATKPILEELRSPILEEKEDTKIQVEEEKIKDVTLCLDGVGYSYDNQKNVISDFSYEFMAGKKYLIQGESGKGKTTLAKIISGELEPTKGTVTISDIPIHKMREQQQLELINYVEQQSYIFEDTIFHNIDLYRNNDSLKIRNCMEQLKIDYLSLEKTVNNMNGISGGEKSRVCLARAVLSLPKFLIVDEPTAALDDKTSLEVMKFLCQLPVTVIIIGHHMKKEQLELFDEVIDLNQLQ